MVRSRSCKMFSIFVFFPCRPLEKQTNKQTQYFSGFHEQQCGLHFVSYLQYYFEYDCGEYTIYQNIFKCLILNIHVQINFNLHPTCKSFTYLCCLLWISKVFHSSTQRLQWTDIGKNTDKLLEFWNQQKRPQGKYMYQCHF